ncbi:MAG: hypothetical protein HY600_07275 [Candidatus Omnitrophica bacterium]|nr:hypothetical protein [Candidatus Omnitrophota bacterium]
MARSRGVAIYGTYALVVGCVNLAGNLWLAVTLAKMGPSAPVGPARAWLAAVVSIGLVAAGVGAFRLRPWGRSLAIATAVATIGLTALNIPHLPSAGGDAVQRAAFLGGYILFPLALNGGLLWFFTRPTVAAQFQPPGPR